MSDADASRDQNTPATGPAVSADATRAALRRYTHRAHATIAAGLVTVIAGGSVMQLGGGYPEHEGIGVQAGGWLGVAGLGTAAYGLLWALNAARMRRSLRRNRWRIWPCRFYEIPSGMTPNGSPTLVLMDGPNDQQFVLGIVSINSRWRKLNPCDGKEVWFAGDPTRGGVAAPPGGSHLLWARRPRLASRRDSLRRQTLERPPAEERVRA